MITYEGSIVSVSTKSSSRFKQTLNANNKLEVQLTLRAESSSCKSCLIEIKVWQLPLRVCSLYILFLFEHVIVFQFCSLHRLKEWYKLIVYRVPALKKEQPSKHIGYKYVHKGIRAVKENLFCNYKTKKLIICS